MKNDKPLLKIFKKYGEIESHWFRSVPVKGVPIEKYNQKMLKKASIIKSSINEEVDSMNCYILYKNKESVEKALVENGKEYDDHHIRVDICTTKNHKQEKNRTLFIGNLPFSCTNEDLRKFFNDNLKDKDCEIENLRIIRDRHTNICKGIGYIVFKNQDIIKDALLLNNKEFQGRNIRITKCKAQTLLEKEKEYKKQKLSEIEAKKSKKTSYLGKKVKFNPKQKLVKKFKRNIKKNSTKKMK